MRWKPRRRVYNEDVVPVPLSQENVEKHKTEQDSEKSAGVRSILGQRHDNNSADTQPCGGLRFFRNFCSKPTDDETFYSTADDVTGIIQTSHGSQAATRNTNKQTRFDTVQVRTYQQILGDNPYVSFPLAIGWSYNETEPHPLEDYDDMNHEQNESYVSAQDQQPLEVAERRARLRMVGYTNKKIQQEECRRKVQIAMEWSYRIDHPDKDIPCTIPNSERVIKRFVV